MPSRPCSPTINISTTNHKYYSTKEIIYGWQETETRCNQIKQPKLWHYFKNAKTTHKTHEGRVGGAGQEMADDKNNWTLKLWPKPPAYLIPDSQLYVRKTAFRFIRSSAWRKSHFLFNSSVGKRIRANEMSWSPCLCNSIVNSESSSNLVITSDRSSDWVAHRPIPVQHSITVCYLHLCR